MTQEHAINQLSDKLNELSARLKSREHSATVLEGVCAQMFNALFGWNLRNLNQEQGNYPGVDLGDETHRVAIQITVHDQSEKATHTIEKIASAKLRDRFDCFLCFFLVPKAPGSRTPDPADFRRWGIRDVIEGILKTLQVPAWLERHVPSTHHSITLECLREAVRIVEETLGRLPPAGPRPNNLPFGRNSHFGQRQEEMAKLEAALEQEGGVAALTQPQIVHGLGGVGKTQLAIQYAWEHAENFTALLWLPSDSESAIATGLARLCEVLDLPEKMEREDSLRAEAVRRWLRTHSGWLLITDNADTPAAQTALLHELHGWHHGRVIITSRLDDWSLQTAPILLGAWREAEGASWLQSRLADRQISCPEEAARALSRELGGLPLALEQAAAYMTQRRIGPGEYLNRFHGSAEAARKLLDSAVLHGGGTGYEATVATTWLVTLDQLTPVAQVIPKLVAWLGSKQIPRSLFVQHPSGVINAARFFGDVDGAVAPFDAVEGALGMLARYSLIELTECSITCHRLVQLVQRWDRPDLWFVGAVALVNKFLPPDPPPDDVLSWKQFWEPLQPAIEALVHHDVSLVGKTADKDLSLAGWPRVLTGFGIYLCERGAPSDAVTPLRRALQLREACSGGDSVETAVTLGNLGVALLESNQLDEAELLMRRALKIREDHFAPDDAAISNCLNSLAALLMQRGSWVEAEVFARRAVGIDKVKDGQPSCSFAISLTTLAQILEWRGCLQEAEEMMRDSLKRFVDFYGPDHPRVATAMNNLASILEKNGKPEESESLLRRSLKINEGWYPADHPKVVNCSTNLAGILASREKWREAEELAGQSLVHARPRIEVQGLNVANALKVLARVCQETDREPEAEPLLREALSIDEKLLDPHNEELATDLNNLGSLLCRSDRHDEAEQKIRRALGIVVRRRGLDHPNTQMVMKNFIDFLSQQNLRPDEIEHRVLKVLAEAEKP